MTRRRSSFTLGIMLATLAGAAAAAEIQGKVAGVVGKDVRLTVEGELLPQPGDEVTIRFEIPGGVKLVVGTWRVASLDGDSVLASLVAASGAPAVDQLATIVSPNPVARRPRQALASAASSAGDGARVRYQGRVYETLYQREVYQTLDQGQMVDRPIDLYFFVAHGAGVDGDGKPRYNRFVRDPAEGHPGVPTWWFCRWVFSDGEWRYVQTKTDDELVVLRAPADAAAYEGSVWNTTSTETSGDRKGQTFAGEFKLTTANGLTRLTSSTTYAEGRIVGDRFMFSTFQPDGSGPVGEGWCVLSGNTLSGGWTSTNGRAGTWEGRRVR